MRSFLLVVLLSFSFNSLSYEKKDSPAPVDSIAQIFLIQKSNEKNRYRVKNFSACKIWLTDQDEPIKGKLTSISDSSLFVDEKAYGFDAIEKIRITNITQLSLGLIALASGATMTINGRLLFQSGMNSPCTGLSCLGPIIIGAGAIVVGSFITIVGSLMSPTSSRKFNLEQWEFKTIKKAA